MRPVIRPNLNVRVIDGQAVLGTDRLAKNFAVTPQVSRLLELMDGTRDLDDIHTALARDFPELLRTDVEAVVDKLLRANLAEDTGASPPTDFSAEELERYHRQLLFLSMFETAEVDRHDYQRRLRDAKVVIFGCGGVGSHTLLNLTCAGVGELVIVDFDTVEASNLNRSFVFTRADVGEVKVDVAAARAGALNPHVAVTPVTRRLDGPDAIRVQLQGADFAVLCADTPYRTINEWFNKACLDLRVPYSLAGSSEVYGTVGPLTVPFTSSCFACQTYDPTDLFSGEPFMVAANRRRMAPSFVPLIAALASLNAMEILKYLTGFEPPALLDRQLRIDFPRFEVTWRAQPRRPDCPACGPV